VNYAESWVQENSRYKWLTNDVDVRKLDKLLGMPSKTIGPSLWVSGDRKSCSNCDREIN